MIRSKQVLFGSIYAQCAALFFSIGLFRDQPVRGSLGLFCRFLLSNTFNVCPGAIIRTITYTKHVTNHLHKCPFSASKCI